jgi:pilus assembly protein FimV
MNLQKIAVQLLIVLNFVTAIPAAYSQQGNLRGPKNSTPRYSEPQPQRQTQPQTQRGNQSDTYGPVVSSDTLWQISQNYRPNNSLSIYQVMQAIYDLNLDAFEQQNLNFLKDGSILRMPSEAYISSVNNSQAKQKAELDAQSLKSNTSSQTAQQAKNTAALDQTRELIEEKLGAIDEAQNRQFLAIRKQFAESISTVQSILDNNQQLSERLNKVNADIDEMRSEGQQKSLQMNQIGESIDELLKKSRQDDALKAAQMAKQETSWLDNPITLILLFTLPILLALSAFAYWMIKRKAPAFVKPEEEDLDDLSLDPIAAEMDNLSDALRAELSGEGDDELDDDNLFGDDDLLDDVLSGELEESLDDALGDSIDDDPEMFDNLGDDDLDELLDEEFEVGSEVVEQDDLDSLFDEDDDDLLAEVQDSDDNSDLDDMLTEEDEPQVDAEVDDIEYEEDESLLAPVTDNDEVTTESEVDDEEQPEISIDDLLAESVKESVETPLIDDSEDINEEVLQNLDKEIISQNEELDSVTGSLIDELEQVEQMRSMLPDDDDDDELFDVEEPQLGIQKLDGLAEEIDEDLLGDEFDQENIDDEIEVDISEVLQETQQPVEAEELAEPESSVVAEKLPEPEQAVAAEELPEPEQAVVAEDLAEPESSVAAEELPEPEQAVAAEELPEPEQAVEAEELPEPEQAVEAEELPEPEQAVEDEELPQPEQAVAAEELVQPEQAVEDEELAEPESSVAAEELPEPEQAVEAEELAESEQAELPEPEQAVEAEELAEPEQSVEAEELPESGQPVEDEELPDPEQAVEAEELREPVQAVEDEELAEPEQAVAGEELPESEQAVEDEELADDSIDEDDELDTELSEDFDMPANSDSTLDEDQLEKALEDFEKEELDEVLEDLTSNEPASISSLDDLEFSADDFVTKNQPREPLSSTSPTLDEGKSVDDFDDSELDNAFDETIDGLSFESSQNSRDELDDLPGLGDWLDDDDVKPNQKQTNADEDDGIIEELEGSSFDEMLETIDLDDDLSLEEDDTGFDIAALLDGTSESEDIDESELDTEDFLDVESLLNESFSAESDDEIDKALDLDIPLEPFVNEQDNLNMIDVDADDGLGAKLDLAHAYIEIGEDDSAKELLDEILKKGSAEQIAEVKIILNKLD